jgi:hypothetical protein
MASEEKNNVMREKKRRNSWILREDKHKCKEEYNDYCTRNQGTGYLGWMQGLTQKLKHPVKSRYMKKVSSATIVPRQPISLAEGHPNQ